MNRRDRAFWLPTIWLIIAVGIIAALVLLSCASVPSCVDNPRNMRCMSADQLGKELNQ